MITKRIISIFSFVLLVSCSDNTDNRQLTFAPVFGEQALTCENAVQIDDKSWLLTQLQFFVSQVQFQDKQGVWHDASLPVSASQSDGVALIGQNCLSGDSGDWQLQLEPAFDVSDFTGMRFSLAVPFELNHLNPLTQASPLNVASMFWAWQTGHKFLRLELQSESTNWLFHLGSTGCKSPSALRAPESACLYPNRFNMELEIKGANDIVFDLSVLLSSFEINEHSSCQSAADEKSCQILFANLAHRANNLLFRQYNAE